MKRTALSLAALGVVLLNSSCGSESAAQDLAAQKSRPLGGSTIENDSGRWLQVDTYDKGGNPIKTMNLRFGDVDPLPDNARKLKIRVNGRSIKVDRGRMRIKIDRNENLVLVD